MMDTTYTVWLMATLRTSIDQSSKKTMLQKQTESIDTDDEDLFKLVQNTVIDDQKGKIVKALDDKTRKLKKHNQELLGDTSQYINRMVFNLNEQVADINEQRVNITYDDRFRLE